MFRRLTRLVARLAACSVLAAAALGAAAPALAQEAAGHPAYSDSQMRMFANATLNLQSLGSQDVKAMTRAIESAGMSVGDYNAMGDAMRSDSVLAGNLNPYLQSAQAARDGRPTNAVASSRAPYAAPEYRSSRPVVTASRSSRHRAVRHSGRHAAAAHHRGGSKSRHASRHSTKHVVKAKASRHGKAVRSGKATKARHTTHVAAKRHARRH